MTNDKCISLMTVGDLYVLLPRSKSKVWMHLELDPVFYIKAPLSAARLGAEIRNTAEFSKDYASLGWPKGMDLQKSLDKYSLILDRMSEESGVAKSKIYKKLIEMTVWFEEKVIRFDFLECGRNFYDKLDVIDVNFGSPRLPIDCSDNELGSVVLSWIEQRQGKTRRSGH